MNLAWTWPAARSVFISAGGSEEEEGGVGPGGGGGGWLAQRHWESAPPASDRDSWSRISGSGSMSVSSGSAVGRRRSHLRPDPPRS